MIGSSLIWGAAGWWLPALLIAACALALSAWSYSRARMPLGARLVAIGLKTLGIVLLALCLLEPLLSSTRARPGANLFVVLADNSQSLAVHDRGAKQARGEALRGMLKPDAAWQTRLGQDFDVRRYQFDARVQSVGSFETLKFDGTRSSLVAALENLTRRYHDRPLAGILLLTDGNATDLGDRAVDWKGMPPVYPVVLGDNAPPRDVAVSRVTVSQTSFEDAPVTVQAEIVAQGYRGEKLVAQLATEAGRVVNTQTVQAATDGEPLAVRFQVRPEQPGVAFYQLRVVPQSEKTALEQPEKSREATLANNRSLVMVDRAGGPYRVLYVGGRPHWEYKFLRRAIDEDQQVQLVSLVRIARREPKFDFRSRTGEATNPLFRGFGNQNDEAAETYDKPVLVRQGTEDSAELRDGFPKTAEDLYRYHAIVLDDLEAEFFTPDQMLLVQKFVSQRGGGLLMLGGQDSFAGGKYDRTPLGEMLPVYLDQLPEVHPSPGHRMALEREGWLQPWVRLRSTEPEERKRLEAMPAFQALNRVRGVKPGATVLAKVVDDDGWEAPALVEQRFGRGRSLALLVGDLWRWNLKRTDDTSDLEKSWRQTVRWLVADVPERIEVEPRWQGEAGGAVRLVIKAHDDRFEPLDNATVRVSVTCPSGAKLDLAAVPNDDEAGSYHANYVPRTPGAYRALVSVAGPDGAQIGSRETGWTSDPAADEFRTLRPNRALLERIAQESQGQLVEAADLAGLVAELPNRRMPISEPSITPLWHQPWVFLLALACLCGEWGLRRWRGLP